MADQEEKDEKGLLLEDTCDQQAEAGGVTVVTPTATVVDPQRIGRQRYAVPPQEQVALHWNDIHLEIKRGPQTRKDKLKALFYKKEDSEKEALSDDENSDDEQEKQQQKQDPNGNIKVCCRTPHRHDTHCVFIGTVCTH